MRTLVDVPDELMEQARLAMGPKTTKADAVRQGLALLVRQKAQMEAVNWFAETDAIGDLNDPEVKAGARR